MTLRPLFLAVVILLTALGTAQAPSTDMNTLQINSVAPRVARITGNTACDTTLYSSWILRDPSPVIAGREEVMYGMGGHIYAPQDFTSNDYMADSRFIDRLYYSYKKDGQWVEPICFGNRHIYPWMNDEAYLTTHLEAYVGSAGNPSVVKHNGKYYMAFSGSVNDLNGCTGEHPESNPYGSCRTPWSYFTIFWATSDDGRNWKLVESPWGASSDNKALDASLLRIQPRPQDTVWPVPDGQFEWKGVNAANLIVITDAAGQDWFYAAWSAWTAAGVKQGMVRMKAGNTPSGLVGTPQILNNFSYLWEDMPFGVFPTEANTKPWKYHVWPTPVGNIAVTNHVEGYKYILPATGSTMRTDMYGSGTFNKLGYYVSNDLVWWSPLHDVNTRFSWYGGGDSYDGSMSYPFYYEEGDGTYSFYVSTSVGPDGKSTCSGSFSPIFVGMSIYKGNSGLQPPPRRRAVVLSY